MKAATRKRIHPRKFVYPPGSKVGGKRGAYPIHDRKHARAALRLGAQSRTKGSIRTIRAAVKRRYPDLVT